MHYTRMTDVSIYPDADGMPRHVHVGVHYPYASMLDPIATYGHVNASTWNITSAIPSGIYMSHDVLHDNTQTHACRITLDWCYTPHRGTSDTRITLVTRDASCLADTHMSCVFGDVDVAATYINNSITCHAPVGVSGYITTLRLKVGGEMLYTNVMTWQWDDNR